MSAGERSLETALVRWRKGIEDPTDWGRPPSWGILGALAWTLSPGMITWPLLPLPHQTMLDAPLRGGVWLSGYRPRGQVPALVLRATPSGGALARIEGPYDLFAHTEDEGWPTRAKITRVLGAFAERVKSGREPRTAWEGGYLSLSIERHIAHTLVSTTPGGRRDGVPSARRALRPAIAHRFHQALRALVEDAGTPARREALEDALAAMRGTRRVDVSLARALLGTGRTGTRARRFATRYPLALEAASQTIGDALGAPGTKAYRTTLWRARIRTPVQEGAREAHVLRACTAGADPGRTWQIDALGRRGAKAVFATPPGWLARWHETTATAYPWQASREGRPGAMAVAEALAAGVGANGRTHLTCPWTAGLWEVASEEIQHTANETALVHPCEHHVACFPERHDARHGGRASGLARWMSAQAAKALARGRARTRQVRGDQKRFGAALRPSARRRALEGALACAQLMHEVRHAIGHACDAYEGDGWMTSMIAPDGTTNWARVGALGEAWRTGLGARVANAVNDARAEPRDVEHAHWESPKPRPGETPDMRVRALTSRADVDAEGRRMDHCVGLFDGSCLNDSALHIYRLEDPEGRASTLGLEEDPRTGEWTIFDHAFAGDLPVREGPHAESAERMRRAFARGESANGYDPARARERRRTLRAISGQGWTEAMRQAARTAFERTLGWLARAPSG